MPRQRVTLERIQKICQEKGGHCLSTDKKITGHSRLVFGCKNGHEWDAIALSVLSHGSWCPSCAGNTKKTIEDAQALATSRGGKCLSKVYINTSALMEWKCAEGHTWKACYDSIKAGTWCPECMRIKSDINRRKYTISKIIEIIEAKEGIYLYSNGDNEKISLKHTLITYRCAEGHECTTLAHNLVHNNSWCPTCGGNLIKTIREMKELAISRNGRCLSENYRGISEPLEWECENKHTWFACAASILRGGWCPQCRNHTQEEKCRYVLDQITGEKFPKDRKTIGMELDGFSQNLSLAFERQGEGHFYINKFFHKNQFEKLREIQERDKLKTEICKQKNINLIIVPLDIQDDAILNFIVERLKELNIRYDISTFTWRDFWKSISIISQAKEIADERNGECLSKIYVNSTTPLLWKCDKCAEEWFALLTNIKRGHWCPRCAGQRITMEEIQEFVSIKGGKCLNKKYKNAKDKMMWECAEGHTWSTSWGQIKQGCWCPFCNKYTRNRKRYSIMQSI